MQLFFFAYYSSVPNKRINTAIYLPIFFNILAYEAFSLICFLGIFKVEKVTSIEKLEKTSKVPFKILFVCLHFGKVSCQNSTSLFKSLVNVLTNLGLMLVNFWPNASAL